MDNCPRCGGPGTNEFRSPCTKCSQELIEWAEVRATAIKERYEKRMADERLNAAALIPPGMPRTFVQLLDDMLSSHDESTFVSWWVKEAMNADRPA